MSAPPKVLELVGLFRRNADAYHAPQYNEAMVRQEFINPLFKCLGWDMDNEQGYAEAYKDVIHEAAIKIGGATKAPDYCFRIGGSPKFFLEAKRPSVSIKDDSGPAYQLRRYAWTGKLPLSVLTDFEEFAVYDCRVKPAHTDKAGVARILYLRSDDYPDRWDEIADVFSREAILKGSFDKFAESNKAKRGTAAVDTAFLQEIESWREMLARNLALRNPNLSQRELNYAVQVTIDRIIFLRMCEDRGIEPYGQLQKLLQDADIYQELLDLYRKADDRYNSGLFHFHAEKGRPEAPDTLTPSLVLDDKPLKDILRGLYYPECPYEFSVLSGEILGQVYEQFLGKVIRLTAAHQAKVEDKPEVRKAGGVYYTPTYIVDYIVKQTVGKLLEGKTPKQAARLRILDPACGSGSFLLGAYQLLLDWHRDRYLENGPKKHTKELYQGAGGVWRLTTAEKKRILLANIYGVDIDPQAVEVTKLSLLLKVLEGESEQTLQSQLKLFHERALPDLSSNIQCGNSLIGPDFYEDQQMTMFDEEERYRINVFDWQKAFPWLRESGGFDVVIGNPPYIRMEAFKELKSYLQLNYIVHDERSDLYVYFIERELNLLRDGGKFGMIVSNKFLRANYGHKVRELITSLATINRILDLAGLPVFRGATVRTIILVTTKGHSGISALYSPPPDLKAFLSVEVGSSSLQALTDSLSYEVGQNAFKTGTWSLTRPENAVLMERIRRERIPLIEVVNGKICMGIKSGLTEAFVINAEQKAAILSKNPEAVKIIYPFLQGRNIRRYQLTPTEEYLIYTYHGIDMRHYPAVTEHLRPFKQRLERRATKQAWYELQQPQLAYRELLENPKIVFPDIATSCRFAIDIDGHFGANTVYFLPTADPSLLGLLNSRLAHFYFVQTCAALEGAGEAYLRFFGQYLEGFPVPRIEGAEKSRHEHTASLVEQILSLHTQLAAAKTPQDQTVVQCQIDATDRQIDQLVYELYGLTDAEIRIVEASGR